MQKNITDLYLVHVCALQNSSEAFLFFVQYLPQSSRFLAPIRVVLFSSALGHFLSVSVSQFSNLSVLISFCFLLSSFFAAVTALFSFCFVQQLLLPHWFSSVSSSFCNVSQFLPLALSLPQSLLSSFLFWFSLYLNPLSVTVPSGSFSCCRTSPPRVFAFSLYIFLPFLSNLTQLSLFHYSLSVFFFFSPAALFSFILPFSGFSSFYVCLSPSSGFSQLLPLALSGLSDGPLCFFGVSLSSVCFSFLVYLPSVLDSPPFYLFSLIVSPSFLPRVLPEDGLQGLVSTDEAGASCGTCSAVLPELPSFLFFRLCVRVVPSVSGV